MLRRKLPAHYECAIPGAALEWARDEVRDIISANGARLRSLDDIAAVCLIRGVIVAATVPELQACIAALGAKQGEGNGK